MEWAQEQHFREGTGQCLPWEPRGAGRGAVLQGPILQSGSRLQPEKKLLDVGGVQTLHWWYLWMPGEGDTLPSPTRLWEWSGNRKALGCCLGVRGMLGSPDCQALSRRPWP